MISLWLRYFLAKISKTFFLFFTLLAFTYIILDLSVHGTQFIGELQKNTCRALLYYGHQIGSYLSIFFPLTFLLTLIQVLFESQKQGELVALQMAGLSQKKLLLPFFLFATLLITGSLFNAQWGIPWLESTQSEVAWNKLRQKGHSVHTAVLMDQSTLVYSSYCKDPWRLLDLFWIRSLDEIWHCKTLYLETDPPLGEFVDCFSQSVEGGWKKTASFSSHPFPKLFQNPKDLVQPALPYDKRPLSKLLLGALQRPSEKAALLSHFYHKICLLILPWLILLVLSPLLLFHRRNSKGLFLTAQGLIGFFAYMTLLDGLLILAENQVFPPFLCLFSPLFLLLFLRLPTFLKR